MEFFIEALRKYFVIKGRATRQEYWMFVLFNTIFSIALILIDKLLGVSSLPLIFLTFSLWTLIPSFTISVRRLHDINKSGTLLLIGLIPLIGGLILLVFFCQPSYPVENKWN